jgi:REP element-mobilizing transposase RayT
MKSSTGLYHIVMRGINRQHIFDEESDYEKFLNILSLVRELSGIKLYAYCLMSNHFHLLIKEGDEPLSRTFRRIGARYVYFYNKKYDRVGHLFQDRYKSDPIENDEYLVAVIRYIFQNPVKAGLCNKAAEYKWSSRKSLGNADSLIDDSQLSEIVSIDDILKQVDFPTADKLLNAKSPGRKPFVSEEDANALMLEVSGAGNTSAFQRLTKNEQISSIVNLRNRHVSIRQASRITGISKGIIEKWGTPSA